jgi:hypothetical protein
MRDGQARDLHARVSITTGVSVAETRLVFDIGRE